MMVANSAIETPRFCTTEQLAGHSALARTGFISSTSAAKGLPDSKASALTAMTLNQENSANGLKIWV